MAHTIMAAFAASLAVAMISASYLADLCFDVCQDAEYLELPCREGCPASNDNEPDLLMICEEQCSEIGLWCRTFCVNNFRLCRQECEDITSGNYACLVTCLQQHFYESHNLTVN